MAGDMAATFNYKVVRQFSIMTVVWGVVGARLYHVITDYQRFDDDPLRAFQIWKGGLSIWGAVIGGWY